MECGGAGSGGEIGAALFEIGHDGLLLVRPADQLVLLDGFGEQDRGGVIVRRIVEDALDRKSVV